MANNSIQPWANGTGSNRLTEAAYKRWDKSKGFEKGTASSEEANTLWAANSLVASAFGQFTADGSGTDVTTDMGRDQLVDAFKSALTQFISTGTGVPGSVVPVGSPIPWPKDEAPAGWLLMQGQSTDGYPVLKQLYGDRLPDMRGQFIRGCEQGRAVLSTQDDQIREHLHTKGTLSTANAGNHRHNARTNGAGAHEHQVAFKAWSAAGDSNSRQLMDASGDGDNKKTSRVGDHNHGVEIDASGDHNHPVTGQTGPTGGSETRPRNIAFNYIVRAA